jgi:hypothetical protein
MAQPGEKVERNHAIAARWKPGEVSLRQVAKEYGLSVVRIWQIIQHVRKKQELKGGEPEVANPSSPGGGENGVNSPPPIS